MGFKIFKNLAHGSRAVIDESAIYLYQRRSCVQHLLGLFRAHDTAYTYYRQYSAGLVVNVSDHRQAALIQRLAAQTSVAYCLHLFRVGNKTFPGVGGVCGYDTGM